MQEPTHTIELSPGITIDLILVEGGTFMMGDDNSDFDFDKPAHEVSVDSFYMGKYQVTQAVWKTIMDSNPSTFKGENRPVDSVSWDGAKDFLQRLNVKTQQEFRLATEAEWEYAARGGRYSQAYIYAGSDKLKQVGWYNENSNTETHDVGLLLANELGLYDMSGNVFEWCEDDYHDNYKGAPADGSAWIDRPKRGVFRVLRGGFFGFSAFYCRSAFRIRGGPGYRSFNIGFRVVLPLQSVG